MSGYPAALALTLAVELPVYAITLQSLLGLRAAAALTLAVAVNLVTHPIVWWVLGVVGGIRGGYEVALLPVELGALASEAAMLWAVLRREPRVLLAVAVAANAASFLIGLILLGP